MNKENVNHPSHYKDMGLESKEIIKLIINNLPEEISRWGCVCIAMELKYRLRAGLKKGEFEEDFLKAMKWREFRNEEVEEDYKKEDGSYCEEWLKKNKPEEYKEWLENIEEEKAILDKFDRDCKNSKSNLTEEEEKFLKVAEENPALNLGLREFMLTFRPEVYERLMKESKEFLENYNEEWN